MKKNSRFEIGDKVTYTRFPGRPLLTIHAIIYGKHRRHDKVWQYFVKTHAIGNDDYGPHRDTISDDLTPELQIDLNPPA
jgi:hypothetical protein